MKERPILFSGPMVRAILEGRKTQTRRVVNPQTLSRVKAENRGVDGDLMLTLDGGVVKLRSSRGRGAGAAGVMVESPYHPYGQPGDRLWVRETIDATRPVARYAADLSPINAGSSLLPCKLIPSIHMPRWASRITLEVVGVRVERVQEISEDDARAEGTENMEGRTIGNSWCEREAFTHLWDSINAKRGHSWESNPWVWVVEFKRIVP